MEIVIIQFWSPEEPIFICLWISPFPNWIQYCHNNVQNHFG